jgi:hypothetical protein
MLHLKLKSRINIKNHLKLTTKISIFKLDFYLIFILKAFFGCKKIFDPVVDYIFSKQVSIKTLVEFLKTSQLHKFFRKF